MHGIFARYKLCKTVGVGLFSYNVGIPSKIVWGFPRLGPTCNKRLQRVARRNF